MCAGAHKPVNCYPIGCYVNYMTECRTNFVTLLDYDVIYIYIHLEPRHIHIIMYIVMKVATYRAMMRIAGRYEMLFDIAIIWNLGTF